MQNNGLQTSLILAVNKAKVETAATDVAIGEKLMGRNDGVAMPVFELEYYCYSIVENLYLCACFAWLAISMYIWIHFRLLFGLGC